MSDLGQTGRTLGRHNNGEFVGRPPKDYVTTDERNQAMFVDYFVHNLTQDQIAAKYGVAQSLVSRTLADMRQRGLVDYAALRAESLAVLSDIRRRQLDIASLKAAPVTAGKDGVVLYDPETNEVVRDYGGVLKALSDAVRTDDAMAKRWGLDAPQKAEVATTVRYEVEGLKAEDLE